MFVILSIERSFRFESSLSLSPPPLSPSLPLSLLFFSRFFSFPCFLSVGKVDSPIGSQTDNESPFFIIGFPRVLAIVSAFFNTNTNVFQ